MRFVHTSDWHLGRLFHGRHLTEDQAYVLDQLIELLEERKANALLISGDVYDRAVPPVEAVRLLDDVLRRIVLDLRIPVIAIAGNHDSPERLAFGSSFLAERGLHVAGPVPRDPQPVVLADAHGPVHFHSVPYAEPAAARVALEDDSLHTHDATLRAMIHQAHASNAPDARHVLLAHAFVTGGRESESERPLSVGGAGMVAADAFAGFDYTALGHLHRPQRAGGSDTLRYSGSLLKYSFNEVDHEKAVLVVDMDADGGCQVEAVPLTPLRDVRIIEGRLDDLLEGPDAGESADDYLLARVTDRRELLNAMGKLRAVYPNTLQLERVRSEVPGGASAATPTQRELPTRALFSVFFEEVTGSALDEAQRAALDEVLEDLGAGSVGDGGAA